MTKYKNKIMNFYNQSSVDKELSTSLLPPPQQLPLLRSVCACYCKLCSCHEQPEPGKTKCKKCSNIYHRFLYKSDKK